MKTRIVILVSFVLMIVACAKDDSLTIPLPTQPQISLSSPDALTSYRAGNSISIKGDVADPDNISTLSLIIYRDAASMSDTLFHKTQAVNNTLASFNESWTPQSGDFSGSTNAYLLEIKLNHDASNTIPSLSYFQEIQVNK